MERNCEDQTADGRRTVLLYSVHAPGISQLADRPDTFCGERFSPENGRG